MGSARRRRLLHVCATFPPHVGGVETHTYEVTRRLADRWDVTVLATDPGSRSTRDERTPDGVQVIRVPAWPPHGDLFLAPGIATRVHGGPWDLVHVQGYHTFVAPLAMVAAWAASLPFLVTLHSGGHASRMRRAMRPAQHLVLRPLMMRARRIIAVSAFERDTFARNLNVSRRRFDVIPNGSDLPEPDGWAASGRNGTTVLSVGRLERYKGHHRLLEALPFLLRERPQTRLRIVGDGRDREDLERRAAVLGVADRVDIQGVDPSDRQAMANLYAGASVVALLSDYESHGLAAIEAAQLGRPLVVTDGSALHVLVSAGDALGVEPDSSPQEIAAAVLSAIERPPRPRMIAPSWDECADALHEIYAAALDDRP